MKPDEKWIRAHLPKELSAQPIDCFSGEYLDGLTVMHEGERGGDDVVVYRAKDEEDLRWWQLEQVCRTRPRGRSGDITEIMPKTANGYIQSAGTTIITPLKTRDFMDLSVFSAFFTTAFLVTAGKEKCRSTSV